MFYGVGFVDEFDGEYGCCIGGRDGFFYSTIN